MVVSPCFNDTHDINVLTPVDLFLPIVLAGFLGFLLTPVTRWLKKIGLSNFWALLIGTPGFLTVLICLFPALYLSIVEVRT